MATTSRSSLPTSAVGHGSVVRLDDLAVGNNGEYFAVSRHCRHLGADLSAGSIDAHGCLVCPWHGASYDVKTGTMTQGPRGVFALVPGLGTMFKAITRIVPLRRFKVEEVDEELHVRR